MTRRRWRASMRRTVNDLVGDLVGHLDLDDDDNNIKVLSSPSLAPGVTQQYSVTTMDAQLAALFALLRMERERCACRLVSAGDRRAPSDGDHRAVDAGDNGSGGDPGVPSDGERGPRVLVFFPTTRLTHFYAECFRGAGLPVLELHSRMTKELQERVLVRFRSDECTEAPVLFTSDVCTRRGSNDDAGLLRVSTVVQVGLPSSAANYLQRLAHCARGGSGRLLICDFEVSANPVHFKGFVQYARPLRESRHHRQVHLCSSYLSSPVWPATRPLAPSLFLSPSPGRIL